MRKLSETTLKIVEKMFPRHQEEVSQLLIAQCGNTLPGLRELDEVQLERFRFAVLKISRGDLKGLRWEISRAQRDWRDTLMAADFGRDVEAHLHWARHYLTPQCEPRA